MAKCALEWRTADGRSRVYETGDFPVAQCRTLELPYEAVWGNLWCDDYVFIGITKRVFQQSFDTPVNRCYEMTGTTLHPGWQQTGC